MELLNWLGFALALVIYSITLLVVAFVHNKNAVYWTLIITLLAGCVWSGVLLISRHVPVYDSNVFFVESFRLASLLLLVSTLTNNKQSLTTILFQPRNLLILAFAIFIPFANYYAWLSKAAIFLAYLSGTVLALVYLEILFKKAKSELWQLKPLMMSLLLLLLFDFIFFSEASLIGQINQDMWLARGYIHAFFVPLLLISIKRTKALGVEVFVSREMVFQSSLLLAAGGYLIVMASVGYYIKSIEAQWTNLTQIIFLVLAFGFLVILLVSEDLKKRFKVFIQKNFFANRFDYRERWVGLTQIISKPLSHEETVYQRALSGFQASVDYDQGMLTKVNGNTLQLLTNNNMTLNEEQIQLCQDIILPFIKQKKWLIDIKEYQQSVQNYPGLIIPYNTALCLNFQVVIPIYEGETLWGLVLLNNTSEQIHFNWEIRDYMKVVSMQLGSYVFQYEANKSLTENAQFAAFNRTSAFVVHDLKNVLAQIRLIIRNSEKHKHNPEFIDDTFETLTHTDSRMQKMLDQLMSKQSETKLEQQFSIKELISTHVIPKTLKLNPLVSLEMKADFNYNLDADRFISVIFHLIDNAQHATSASGSVSVTVNVAGDKGLIEIEDTGTGMSQAFIDNDLFAPFVTTKGNAGMGIGAYDAKQYIESMSGHLSVNSELNVGSKFVISLPLS